MTLRRPTQSFVSYKAQVHFEQLTALKKERTKLKKYLLKLDKDIAREDKSLKKWKGLSR